MQAAAVTGLYGFPLSTTINCASANCTWHNDYTVLGFESTCNNVTSLITQVCEGDGPAISSCKITTPANNTLQVSYVATETRTLLNMSSVLSNFLEYDVDTTIDVHSPNLITFAVYRYNLGQDWDIDRNLTWDVMECSLGLAGYKYSNVSVQNSEFKIGNTEQLALGTTNFSYGVANGNSQNPIVYFNSTQSPQTFAVNSVDLLSLVTFLQTKVFNGSLVGGDSSLTSDNGLGAVVIYDGNITEIATNMATSMTTQISSGGNATLAKGDVLTEETYVAVHWPFLSLPIASLVATAIFLAATILKTSKQHSAIWKSSSVALLLHQVVGWDGRDAVLGEGTVLEESKHVKLKLSEDGKFEVY